VVPQVVDLVAVLAKTAQSPSQSLTEEAELKLPKPENQSVSDADKLSNSSMSFTVTTGYWLKLLPDSISRIHFVHCVCVPSST